MPYKVFLKKNEERRLLAGHAWVYANEVARIEGKDKNGSLAAVYANDGRFIGRGYINHLSKILVRIFLRSEAEEEDAALEKRIRAAFALRETLFGAETDCYRCVFAEADDLPALIVDRYGDYLVAEFLSLGMDQRREKIADILEKVCAPKGICLRGDAPVRRKEGLPLENRALRGEIPERILVRENGLVMEVDVLHGQKTGYFLDQKENRLAVRRYCRGARVLDCFCNSGGFSLNAAAVAREVTAVDISPLALESVRANAARNGFTNIRTVCADAFEHLRALRAAGEKFGCVILDPPAFCKSAAEVPGAYRGYKDVNLTAMKLVEPGGFLVTCSCSHYMTMPLFEKMLRESARDCGRRAKVLEVRVQAPDHPALLAAEETSYLKAYILQIE
ncbi:MAG TPA: class I SAM-dependent rRNA methyltransferase [Candidatus Borkfalkia faecigallinarum]|uniref:Class I SAM-dependent rRNA methyltransferase n=1 Tax=Candidatus Borkfalkia faecigallinarum TaxID=2838509 RepID=A0A9D1VUA1_9FIRM|nr:class I SAM-dependent rRNA methyltransferase [Candidatus Borkfalkia faecigallinarum]